MNQKLEQFVKERQGLLQPPAAPEALGSLRERFGDAAEPLVEVFSRFDGEVSWGALLPGLRLSSIAEMLELMGATEGSWDFEEEALGHPHVMRTFAPFASTIAKTSFGVILDAASPLAGWVIEYHYESGTARLLARRLDEFFSAFATLALERLPPPIDLAAAFQPHVFSDVDRAVLAREQAVFAPDQAPEVDLASQQLANR